VRGSEQGGLRPGLVIQNDVGNQFSQTTIVAGLTRTASRGYPHQVSVSADESGLRERSTVMLNQILTVDVSRLRQLIGRLSPQAMIAVDAAIHRSLGLVD